MDAFSAGVVAGIAQTCVGQPLDTMKTLLQSNGAVSCAPRHLYAGLLVSMLQSGLLNGFLFQIEASCYNWSQNRAVSSLASGFFTSFLICPLENAKINQQRRRAVRYGFAHLVRTYRHIPITALREMPGNLIYFQSYERLRETQSSFVAGSFAGAASWFATYPIDTVKSRLQTEQARTLYEAVRQGALCRGLGFCLARALLANGVGFFIYERLRS